MISLRFSRLPSTARSLHAVLAAACLTLALGGCAALAPEPAAEPVEVPSAWSAADVLAAGGNPSLVQWWLRFGDPLLDRLVSEALSANTSVRSAQAALRQARAWRDIAAAGRWPVVDASASAQRTRADLHTTNAFAAGLDASWELDFFGAKRSALESGEATLRASAASLGDVQVSVAAEVALDYIILRNAQARLTIARSNLASQQETLQLTRWRLQAGLVTALEAEQARTLVEQVSALVPSLQTSIAQTSHALAVLTGRPPAALSTLLAAAAPVPQAADDLALSIPAETLRQRPDVRAAEYRVRAAVADVDVAQAARLPNFSLGGSLGLNALTWGTLGNAASAGATLLAGVTLPVFDAGAARAQVRAQQAALDQAGAAYQAALLGALADVENALVALRGDRLRVVNLRNAAEAAGNAAALARQRYASGLVDFQVVLETQRTQLTTQDSQAQAGADVASDHVRLYKALGGGWQPEAGEPAR